MNRREFHRWGTLVLGNLMALALAVPGVAYLLDPLRKRGKAGAFRPLARLGELKVGEPKAYPVLDERTDAWVKYPKEPVGSVWLIRQPDDSVVAFTAECPHLGCAVNLSADGRSFLCPCHTSAFGFDGSPKNQIPPRAMDRLAVEVDKSAADPEVRVKFERFQTGHEEKKSLV